MGGPIPLTAAQLRLYQDKAAQIPLYRNLLKSLTQLAYALFAIHPQLLLVEALVDSRQKLTPSGRAEGMFVGVGWGRYVGALGWLRSRMGRLHSMCVQLQSICVYHSSLNNVWFDSYMSVAIMCSKE